MKPWTMWLARLGLAWACVMAVGCGGSGVPDPSADEQAATDSSPPPDGGEAVPPLNVPPPATPLTQGRKIAVANGPGAPKAAEAPEDDTASSAPDPDKTPAPAKTEGSSATAEMLAMATNSNAGANAQPNPGTTPPAAQGAPSPPMGSAMMQMMQTQGGRQGMAGSGPPGAAGGAGAQMRPGPMGGGGGGVSPSDMAGMTSQMKTQMQRGQGGPMGGQGAMAARGGPGAAGGPGMAGRFGGAAGPGGSPANDKPANFHNPEGAVEAFLNALVAKDPDRLLEASALRASVEPPERNKTLFKKIFDLSLSDSEIDDLAKSFEGYKIAGENPQKSTGRIEVILQKNGDDGSRYTRVVTVRREQKGWGVLLLKTPTEFKPMGQTPRRRPGGGGGGGAGGGR